MDYRSIFIKPFTAFIGMFIAIKCCNLYLTANGIHSSNMTISSLVGLVFFFLVLFLTGTFTAKQLKSTFAIK